MSEVKSFRVFMENLIDYAGVFPPASLSLETAMKNYVRIRQTKYSWIISRFLCPSTKISHFFDLYENNYLNSGQWKLSLIFPLKEDTDSLITAVTAALADLNQQIQHHPNIVVDMFEIKIPPKIFQNHDTEAVKNVVLQMTKIVKEKQWLFLSGKKVLLFFEVPSIELQPQASNVLIQSLYDVQTDFNLPIDVGIKVRCGGLTANAFPSIPQISTILINAAKKRVYFKATAGLHQPLRYYDSQLHVEHHGFLNIFSAAMISYLNPTIDPEIIEELLTEKSIKNFTFDENEFKWKNWRLFVHEMEQIRHYVKSFGSCDFDEPIAALKEIGLLN